MPTVFVDGDKLHFETCVVKRNGYVVGMEHVGTDLHKHHFPPNEVSEIEGDVKYEK